MATQHEKYFIAIVPPEPIFTQAEQIKFQLKEKFNLKYSLKSPAHITLKMPFSWNAHKEDILIKKLQKFSAGFQPFEIALDGFDRFGRRVLFIDVLQNRELSTIQSELKKFAKVEMKLVEELSDKAFHPHMTIAFKDTKPNRFDDYWSFVKQQSFTAAFPVKSLTLLKRISNRWESIAETGLGAS